MIRWCHTVKRGCFQILMCCIALARAVINTQVISRSGEFIDMMTPFQRTWSRVNLMKLGGWSCLYIYCVQEKVIWTVNRLNYLNYEPIARTSSTRHLVRTRNVLGQTVSSYGWCNGIPRVVPLFRYLSERFASDRLSCQR